MHEIFQQGLKFGFGIGFSPPFPHGYGNVLRFRLMRIGNHSKNMETIENFRELLEFFYETLGYDRINNNIPLGTITYTKQSSMMVVETDTLMTYVVAY